MLDAGSQKQPLEPHPRQTCGVRAASVPASNVQLPASARYRHRVQRFTLFLVALVMLSALTASRCYPSGTRVVIFVQGIYTTYDASGTQETVPEGQRFNVIKNDFIAKGYERSALLDFSYAGGAVRSDGTWAPQPYTCDQTDRFAADNLGTLEQMLRDYGKAHKNTHFTLVGHSLGGYLSFLEGAREAKRTDADKLGIDAVVTIDAPLQGADADKKVILDLVPCDKTYRAGAEIVAQKLDAGTPELRRTQTDAMAQQGIRLATLGNMWDCLWNTGHCLPGGTWVDDSGTQFLPGASISTAYTIASGALFSHDAILADATAMHDAVTFVGAP